MDGWIKLYSKMKEWEWFTDAYVLQVFVFLLLSANFKDGKTCGRPVKRGQYLTSIRGLAAALQMNERTAMRALKTLVESDTIEVQSDRQNGTLITIKKYSEYQENQSRRVAPNTTPKENSVAPNTTQSTTPTKSSVVLNTTPNTTRDRDSVVSNTTQSTTPNTTLYIEEYKERQNIEEGKIYISDKSAMCVQNQPSEIQFVDVESTPTDKPTEKEKSSAKKEKEERHKFGNYQNVLLTDEEANSLRKEYGEDTISIVDNYSEYKEMKGYKCKRDYIAIKRWGAKAYYEQLDKNQKKSRYGDSRNNPTSPDYVSTERIVEAGIAMARANN